MTAYYVRSAAAGAGTGTDWANAYTTLVAAFSGHAAGDVYYVAADHAETNASQITLTSNGTLSAPTLVYCVDHTGSVPPVSADFRATAAVSCASNIRIGSTGTIFRGIIFTAGEAAAAASIIVQNSSSWVRFENCSLRLGGTGSSNVIDFGNAGSASAAFVELINTTVSFAGATHAIQCALTLYWENTVAALLGTIPTTLFKFAGGSGGKIVCRGIDFSAMGSGKTLIGGPISTMESVVVELTDCKIDAAVTLASTPPSPGAIEIDAVRVGASGVNYNQARIRYAGTLIEETTIVLTGGASNGTTPISWKITTTANSSQSIPFRSPAMAIWNDTVGSPVTATLQGIWGGGALPKNDDIWIEAQYLGSGSSPLASFVNSGKADPLASNAALAAGTGTWGGSTTKFKMAVTFTPQQKGWIYLRIKAAAASSTFYVDPKITMS